MGYSIISLRNDCGNELENNDFTNYLEINGINHNFLTLRTTQQNEAVERKNRCLEEMARTVLNENPILVSFQVDAVSTTYYVLNRALIRFILNNTPYQFHFGRKPRISHFHIFGCNCFVHSNGNDNLNKFNSKIVEALFIGYSSSSKAFHVFNKRTLKIEESIYVVFDKFSLSANRNKEDKKEDWMSSTINSQP